MKTSRAGIDLIKGFEKFAARRYLCPAGKPTIGYGHVILEGEDFPEMMPQEEAEALLAKDLVSFERKVTALVKVPVTQEEFDAEKARQLAALKEWEQKRNGRR